MYPELKKLYKNLCGKRYTLDGIDIHKLKIELEKLENNSGYVLLNESLSLGGMFVKRVGGYSKMKGCFTVQDSTDIKFDIKCELQPSLVEDEVPELQRKLYVEVEHANSVIKNLIGTSDDIKIGYFKKLLSLAQVGLVGEKAQPVLALESIKKLQEEILLSEGMRIKTSYMTGLGQQAILIGLITSLLFFLADCLSIEWAKPYCCAFGGTLVGTWISFGARKFNVTFEELSLFEKDMMDKSLRLIYVGIASVLVLMMFNINVIHFHIGEISTVELNRRLDLTFFMGAVCGLVESNIGIHLYERARVFVSDYK